MASHFKFHDGLDEVVPFNARYAYPTQANRAWKQTIKIPTINGNSFRPQGANPQITLPAQGYLNTRNTFLQFDATILQTPATPGPNPGDPPTINETAYNIRFQNNIQSVFNRMQLRYGSLSLEDLRETGPLIRILTDGAATNTVDNVDQNAIAEGIGGCYTTSASNGAPGMQNSVTLNSRVDGIQVANWKTNLVGAGSVRQRPIGMRDQTRTYLVQLPFGLFQQNKLIPLKWMASQLTVELTLAAVAACMCGEGNPTSLVGYELSNISLNAEILEFDGSYDAAILEGLRGQGVPLKFASWDTFVFTPASAANQTIQIPERNRSLKAIFCVQVPPAGFNVGNRAWDSHALLQSSANVNMGLDTKGGGFVNEYQWRIGGKYYPAQPVRCGDGTNSNGAAEAYREFQKALNIVGDYRLSTGQTPQRWCPATKLSSLWDWPSDNAALGAHDDDMQGPSSFVIALDMETSSGAEVSGMNGEEQNDINLTIRYDNTGPQSTQCQYLVYVYHDALLILRENGAVELIK